MDIYLNYVVLSLLAMLSAYGIENAGLDVRYEKYFGKHHLNEMTGIDVEVVGGESGGWSMRKLMIERKAKKQKIYKKWIKRIKFKRREDPKAKKHFMPKRPYKHRRKYFTDRDHVEWLQRVKDWHKEESYVRLEAFTGRFVTLNAYTKRSTYKGTRWWTFKNRKQLREEKERLLMSRTYYPRGRKRPTTAPRRRSPRTRRTKPPFTFPHATVINEHSFFGKFNL